MQHKINFLNEKKVVGLKMTMSFANNTTTELWQRFMPGCNAILNKSGSELYSIQTYAPLFFDNFAPNAEFTKWAGVEVTDFATVPDNMTAYTIPSGLYVVFLYKGAANEGAKAFEYILTEWLPQSIYELDNRPHFEVLCKKYKNNAPDSEEEIWIPIKPTTTE